MISIRKLDRSYNAKMLDILESSPMSTPSLEIHFDKSPDIFLINELWSDCFEYYGIFLDGRLVGFGKHLEYRGFLNGGECNYSYFGDYCISPKYRHMGLYKRLAEYMIKTCLKSDNIGFAIILEGNDPARRYLQKDSIFNSIDSFKILGNMLTKSILITGQRKPNKNLEVKRAKNTDLAMMEEMIRAARKKRILAPIFDSRFFRKKINGNFGLAITDYYLVYKDHDIIGLCGAWNLEKLKRTRIVSYRKKFKWIYFFYRFAGRILGYPSIPAPGKYIKEIYLTDVVIKNNNTEVFKALISRIYEDSRKSGINLIHFGSYEKDPLLEAFSSFRTINVKSNLFISAPKTGKLESISNNTSINRPFIDVALV